MATNKNYPSAPDKDTSVLDAPEDTTKLGGYTGSDEVNKRSTDNTSQKEPLDQKSMTGIKVIKDLDQRTEYHEPAFQGNGYTGKATAAEYITSKLVKESTLDINYDDLQALLESTSDDAEFVSQALDIFKATVNSVIEDSILKLSEAAVEIIEDEARAELEETIENLEESYNDKMEQLEENVSDYLDAIVLEWADENKLAIQDTTRTALAESFMADLTQLLEAYNIDIPQEKTDLYEASLETGQKLFDEYSVVKEENEQLKAELDSLNKFVVTESFISESPELSLVEAEKLRKVSKELTYESIDDFARKLSVISESYQSKRAPKYELQPQSQDSLFEDFYGEPDYGFQEEIVESYEDTDSYKIDPLVAAIAGKI